MLPLLQAFRNFYLKSSITPQTTSLFQGRLRPHASWGPKELMIGISDKMANEYNVDGNLVNTHKRFDPLGFGCENLLPVNRKTKAKAPL